VDSAAISKPERPPLSKASTAAVALLAVAFAAAYAPNFVDLYRSWMGNATYSHGLLIVPFALYILHQRRDRLDPAKLAPSAWGWAVLAVVLGLRYVLYQRNEVWFENLSILPALAGLALAFGGWHLLRWAALPIAYLAFMLPLPGSLNTVLAGPLQSLATMGSTVLLQGLGLPVLAEGNVINVGTHELEVAQACNGLSMLEAFAALIVAVTITVLADRPRWERVVLVLSIVPIALISNILRITATAWCYHRFGTSAKFLGWTVDEIEHAVAGWAMMPIALALIWVEQRLMGWLVVEEDADRRAPAVRPLVPMAYGGVAPLKPAGKDKPRSALPGIDPE
jgi:exosortase